MEKKPLLLTAVAILAGIAALAFGYSRLAGGSPSANLKPLEYLGQQAGEETARLLSNQGKVVAIWERFEGRPNPNAEAQLKGFKTVMDRNKGLTLTESKEFVRALSDDPRLWPAGQAASFVKMGAGADAVVLFVTMPMSLSPEDVSALKASQTKFVIVGGQSPILSSLIEQKAVQLAIVNRIPPKPAGAGPETPVQWYDRVFMVVKPL